jgi:hypothetical protein
MRKRGILCLIAAGFAILAFKTVSNAQRLGSPPRILQIATPEKVDDRPPLPSDEPAGPGRFDPPPPAPGDGPTRAIGDDPMAAVDAFLDRNRKEADDSIRALTKEAEALRARLEKVEAALARWQSVSEALNRGTDRSPRPPGTNPSSRIRWNKPEPGPTPPPGQSDEEPRLTPIPSRGVEPPSPPPSPEDPGLPQPGPGASSVPIPTGPPTAEPQYLPEPASASPPRSPDRKP